MKKNLLFAISFLFSATMFAQSPRQVVIEHFTNTRCGTCASKNPAFYQTLSTFPSVLHIAYHPSSPYSQCYFSLQNPAENDARTNHYGIFGSTPRVVINGKPLAAATPLIKNMNIDTVLDLTSPIEVAAYEELITLDSVNVRVVIKTTETNTLSTLRLFVGIAENPVNYNANNGETIHYDVFRKALTAATGNAFAVPALGDSAVFEFTYAVNSSWNVNKTYTLALVQREDTKEVLNAGKSVRLGTISGINEVNESLFSVYPNPVNNVLQITGLDSKSEWSYSVYDISARKLLDGKLSDSKIEVSELSSGIYFVRINGLVKKFVKD